VDDEVRESGLRNLRRRAEELDGEMRVVRIDPHGTRRRWRVPTRA
jgi:signal transduction histidine kinase